ncbi:GTP-binding protein [Luteipulveratus sp. YIM 133132]|uniref:sulfate adenylyltransferase subunit 1 n=1 Tax=Luteipulveratus flavus TaxID=3031728 RepID=UPI0023B11421|nr:GTP-binding protein [Luteipulveratus sp. YIM 133132]MDE9367640.1 GTP-binding protein [Luteipulveratus sp. YIM 133132]
MTVLTERPAPAPDDPPAAVGQLRLVVAGSVDDGKSTLVGRLLHDTKSILADQYDALEHVSRSRGADGFDLALLTDGLRAEREQGITIDVAYRYFATPRRSFVLADTPGHVQYTRNTVTGASTADAAVVLVDVRNGASVQTRRHAAVMALLRVPHVVFAVNKMDAVDWDEARFAEVEADVRRVAERVGLEHTEVLPVSALTGEGVAAPAPGRADRPTLLSLLEQLPARRSLVAEDLRFAVQLVIRPRTEAHPDYRGLAGRVGSGTVSVGDEVVAQPSGLRSTVVAVDGPRGPQQSATAGQSVTLRLADELDVARGEVLSRPDSPAPAVRSLDGVVCWLGDAPTRPRQRVLVKAGTRVTRGMLGDLEQHWDVDEQRWQDGDAPLELNDIGRLSVQLAEPVAVDPYVEHRHTGAFLVIDPDTGVTLGAGMAGGRLGQHS